MADSARYQSGQDLQDNYDSIEQTTDIRIDQPLTSDIAEGPIMLHGGNVANLDDVKNLLENNIKQSAEIYSEEVDALNLSANTKNISKDVLENFESLQVPNSSAENNVSKEFDYDIDKMKNDAFEDIPSEDVMGISMIDTHLTGTSESNNPGKQDSMESGVDFDGHAPSTGVSCNIDAVEMSSEAAAVPVGAEPERDEQINSQHDEEDNDSGQHRGDNSSVDHNELTHVIAQETSSQPEIVSNVPSMTENDYVANFEHGHIEDSVHTGDVCDDLGSPYHLGATATVRFMSETSGHMITMACSLGQTIEELKILFAKQFKVPSNVIYLTFEGKPLLSNPRLADLGVGANGTIQLETSSLDPDNNPILLSSTRQKHQMPDVISVTVQSDDGEPKQLVVEIANTAHQKPYLGGFRHKFSQVEYHNASVQTRPKLRAKSGVDYCCRDTQTVELSHCLLQTANNTSTQMTGIGIFISNMGDKLVKPGRYMSADERQAITLEKVIILQKYYRRFLATRYVNKLREDKRRRLEWEDQEGKRKMKETDDRTKKEFQRRMYPKTKEDFDLLYAALERWRLEELERINESMTGEERKAATCLLLDRESHLLAAIDRHKQDAAVDNKAKRIRQFMDKAASPKKWTGVDGKVTEMDTPYTVRAKELREIHDSVNMKFLTQDERLDVLLTLRHTVKEHDCKLTQEIMELVDREADLLMRGVKESKLAGLRKRISTLFLQYIRTPIFNPQVSKLLKVPQDSSCLRKNIYFCPSCNEYLPSTAFHLSSNNRTAGRCRLCVKVDNEARTRYDHIHYQRMLRSIRRSEESLADGSKICFLVQERDILYLVENIWNGQSILSALQDIRHLVLVRWDRHSQWAPWNCILLTVDESQAHNELTSLDDGYEDVFMQKVRQKHTLARNYFSRLPGMVELMRLRCAEALENVLPGPSSISGHAINYQSQNA